MHPPGSKDKYSYCFIVHALFMYLHLCLKKVHYLFTYLYLCLKKVHYLFIAHLVNIK